jgi:deazaflavin-dependent oxidoreductase (nitroreductase family)
MELSKIYNPIVKAILRLPFHGLISKNIMLITFTGRKSGRNYTTPVSYVQNDDELTVFILRRRNWWRNLRGGASVSVRLKGKKIEAIAMSIEDKKTVTSGLQAYLQKMPNLAKYFQVSLDPNGHPDPEDVVKVAKERVMLRVKLS